MSQKKIMRNNLLKLVHPKVILIVLAVLFVAAQVLFDIHVYRWTAPQNDTSIITGLVSSAIENLTKPAVVEPVSKKVYLPDASIVLPAYPNDLQEIRYTYSAPIGNYKGSLNVTSTAAVRSGLSKLAVGNAEAQTMRSWWSANDPTKVFSAVPNAQACSRGVQVFFDATSADGGSGLHLVTTHSLKDGRTLYIYTEQTNDGKPACSFDLTPVVNYLEQADSY